MKFESVMYKIQFQHETEETKALTELELVKSHA